VLGWLGLVESVDPLLQLLEEETLEQEAMAALVDLGRVAPQALLDAWPKASGNRRACLAFAMGEAGCSIGVPLLRQGLRDGDSQIVRLSAHALGRTGDAETLPDLVTCLSNEAPEVREAASQALIALGRRAPGETFAALRPLLNHSDPGQRMFAVMVLRELDHPGVLEALGLAVKDSAAEVRRAAVKVFERCDISEHLSTLLLSLTDEDAEVRRTVVDILANCRDQEAFDGLQLALQDEDIWVRSSAVRGLGRVGGASSRALVEKALADPVGLVRIAALETLASLVGAAATPQMLAALDHDDEDVVTAAMALLSRTDATDWVAAHAERLLDHPFWTVRSQIARCAVTALGAAARPLLEKRLSVENEALVRQHLADLLDELPVD
jgi:HEAT repeat protein